MRWLKVSINLNNLNSTSWDGWKLALYFALPGQNLRDSPTRSCSPLWDIPLVLLCYPPLICSLVNIQTLFLSCVSLHVYFQVPFSIWGFWILEVHAFWFDLLENKGFLFLCIEFSGSDSSLVFKLWLVICLNQCFWVDKIQTKSEWWHWGLHPWPMSLNLQIEKSLEN